MSSYCVDEGTGVMTFFCPPPGTCPMLPREPTFDWTLNSSFSFLISMFPPPEQRNMVSMEGVGANPTHWPLALNHKSSPCPLRIGTPFNNNNTSASYVIQYVAFTLADMFSPQTQHAVLSSRYVGIFLSFDITWGWKTTLKNAGLSSTNQ